MRGSNATYERFVYIGSVHRDPNLIPVPVEVEIHTVPHFKAPVNNKLEPRGPEHGGILIS